MVRPVSAWSWKDARRTTSQLRTKNSTISDISSKLRSTTVVLNITDNGSFAGFADPVTGAALASNGPVNGSYQLTVTSAHAPDAANLPAQMDGDVRTADMIKQLFGDPGAVVIGGPYSYSYQNGSYVQDTNGVSGDVRGH